ncbi:hypothetical protein UFOVP119_54 [uncultured Caudovirales phage]|uniref:Uncharacterized protein n=1 Tax=uncultured Caudovirales phage TaxID=2100421 RepID=A0A6J5LBX1_9CAUD|nr:hypothetical protein UFOVP119_54 [uncultured Caudovirales phage]
MEVSRPERASYLGDAVYAVFEPDRDMIRLTTGDHRPELASATIYLERDVLRSLVDFAHREGFYQKGGT